jgi:divalent metal cation (Fe/Co/Zn/Cd) transporter
MHVLVPGQWSVHQGHDLLERIEGEIRARLPNTTVTTHMEPIEDPRAWDDAELQPVRAASDRVQTGKAQP